MISVIERQVESWIDSQTERRYQPAFIQLLISEGWNVLHNTRHSPIELGKDVIARCPKGVLHCFQLKGNPGTRVTKSEAQSLLFQFLELLELPPSETFRKNQKERHVAVFVTNGEIDEEAQLLFEKAGSRTKGKNCAAKKFELWTRGTLVNRFLKTVGKVWPTTLEGTRQVLNIMAGDGLEAPDPTVISAVLSSSAPAPNSKTSSAAKTSNLTSLLLTAEIVKSPWYSCSNHYGLYVVTVLASIQALRFADTTKRLATVTQYANLALEHCSDLVSEAKEQNFDPDLSWAQREVFAETGIMWERRRLVGDCAATLVLSESSEIAYDENYVSNLVEKTYLSPRLWGLAAVPALIVRYWAATRLFAGAYIDLEFGKKLLAITEASQGHIPDTSPLASPYYNFTDCWAYSEGLRFVGNDSIYSDSFKFRLWFARPMLFMLAKRNYKQTCKYCWASFTKSVHEEPSLPANSFFDSELTKEGEMNAFTYHYMKWADLVEEAVSNEGGEFLDEFSDLAWLIAAYVAIVPYRGWTGVLMWLDTILNTTWYSRNHLPPT